MEVGEVFAVPYPFVRDKYMELDQDEEGVVEIERQTWRPGTRFEEYGREGEYTDCLADAMGTMRVTVVSLHKPGRYPARVFYTRQWIDPDGKQFGKGKLRITTEAAFRILLRGYRYQFEIASKPAA